MSERRASTPRAGRAGRPGRSGRSLDPRSPTGEVEPVLRPPAVLGQDPHERSGVRDKLLEAAIGREVHRFRTELGITVSDLASAAGLSAGMLSKIENGVISPSLTTLQALARALGVPITALFRRFEEKREAVFVKAGEGLAIERRGTRNVHRYHLLGHTADRSSKVVVKPYVITLTSEADVFPLFQHSGIEFQYIVESPVVYRHGGNIYTMNSGDILLFELHAPHGPEILVRLPIHFYRLFLARTRTEIKIQLSNSLSYPADREPSRPEAC